MCSASSACRCASTPSLTRPGSTPRSWLESSSTCSIAISNCSPALLVTVHLPLTPSSEDASSSTSLQGGDIQFSGLYEPPSECTSTEPSALTNNNRVAIGRCAVNRPT